MDGQRRRYSSMLAARARRRRLQRRLSIVIPVAALFFYLAVRTRPTPSTPTPATPTLASRLAALAAGGARVRAAPGPVADLGHQASPAVAVAATPKPPAVVATPRPPAVVHGEFVVERRTARLRIIGGGQGLPASLNFAGRRLVLGRRSAAGRDGLRAPELLGARTARTPTGEEPAGLK